jgi:predicted kinase
MKTLYLIRGLPGSGKSTVGRRLVGHGRCFAADDFFTDCMGAYRYDRDRLTEAHQDCERRVREMMAAGGETRIAVANTFVERKNMEPYRALAREHGYDVVELTVKTDLTDEELAARNEHGVPADVIARMRGRFDRWPEGVEIEDYYIDQQRGRQIQFYVDGKWYCSLSVWGEEKNEAQWIIQTGDNSYDVRTARHKADALNAAAMYVENIERVVRERAQAQEGAKG